MKFYSNLGEEILSSELMEWAGPLESLETVECFPSSQDSFFETARKRSIAELLKKNIAKRNEAKNVK